MSDLEKQAHNYRISALIVEQQIRVEAMKAENCHRERQGLAQAYSENMFAEVADEVNRLSTSFVF